MGLLQGTELYSTSLQPDNPNLQFDAQVTGSLQSQYNQGYKSASILYGSIMNPSLSRADTQKAKEEYLKMVEQDLRTVGKIDWSISENITSAENLFKGMWSNKLLLKDAKWTKNYQDELSKAEGFRNCLDPAKCGGQYWDEGVKYMNYKRQEFMNSDSDTAMMFDNVSYVPYNSVMDSALKQIKAADLSMKADVVNGGYIVTTKNGEQLRSPLTVLFNETLGKDPKLMEMFKVKSYVDRKDWVTSKIQTGEYANESEANLNYLNSINNKTISVLNKHAEDLGMDQGFLDQRLEYMKQQFENGEFEEGTEMYNKMLELYKLKSNTDNALNVVSQLKQISQSKNKAALNVMIESFDNENAFNYFDNEIKKAVDTLIYKDYEQKLEIDPYSMEEVKFGNKLKEMERQYSYDVALENRKQAGRLEVEKFKAENNIEEDDFDKQLKFDRAVSEVTAMEDLTDRGFELYVKSLPAGDPKSSDKSEYLKSLESKDARAIKALKEARQERVVKKMKANEAAESAGFDIKYPEVLHPTSLLNMSEEEIVNAINQTESLMGKDLTGRVEDIKKAIYDSRNQDKPLYLIINNL